MNAILVGAAAVAAVALAAPASAQYVRVDASIRVSDDVRVELHYGPRSYRTYGHRVDRPHVRYRVVRPHVLRPHPGPHRGLHPYGYVRPHSHGHGGVVILVPARPHHVRPHHRGHRGHRSYRPHRGHRGYR